MKGTRNNEEEEEEGRSGRTRNFGKIDRCATTPGLMEMG